jgi:transcription antitermination factor NusG
MPGTPVRVVVGPLSGVEGELVRIRNQHRLVLNTTILGQAVSVEINADDVQKV